jgi:tRNA threonylcarbamoyladenosine biosynthesis protein TsaE
VAGLPCDIDHITTGPAATLAAGARLGEVAQPGTVLGLVGELGAGKTLFVQGVARGLGVPAGVRVVSPTFTLINEYRGGRLDLFHADLYRLERAEELAHIGLDDVMDQAAVVAVEWSDRFAVLPRDALHVELAIVDDATRRLTATATGPISAAVLAAWRARVG